MFSPSSRGRLTARDFGRFPDDTLFHRIARAVCRAGCLPRKELYEAWETARRVRRLFHGGRVVDVCGGHGLLAHIMLLLDAASPLAVVIDQSIPPSSEKIRDELVREWPRLAGKTAFVERTFDDVEMSADDLVVSIHACGALTDRIIARAVAAHARLAVLPCCHDFASCDSGALTGWMDAPLAIDVTRAVRLQQQGYRVWTQEIPPDITSKNRLLIAAPIGSEESLRSDTL